MSYDAALTPSALSPEVAPAITGMFGQQYVQAFQASDGTLWKDNPQAGGNQVRTDGVAHTLGSHSGPAKLPALDEDSQNTTTTLATNAGPSTTRAIAAADNGRTAGFFEAYVDTHGNVTVIRPDGNRVTEAAFTVRPGIGVSIAVNSVNDWDLEAQAPNTKLWDFSDQFGTEQPAPSRWAPPPAQPSRTSRSAVSPDHPPTRRPTGTQPVGQRVSVD